MGLHIPVCHDIDHRSQPSRFLVWGDQNLVSVADASVAQDTFKNRSTLHAHTCCTCMAILTPDRVKDTSRTRPPLYWLLSPPITTQSSREIRRNVSNYGTPVTLCIKIHMCACNAFL